MGQMDAESQAMLCSPSQNSCVWLCPLPRACLAPMCCIAPGEVLLILTKVPRGLGAKWENTSPRNYVFLDTSICVESQENSHSFIKICHSGLIMRLGPPRNRSYPQRQEPPKSKKSGALGLENK